MIATSWCNAIATTCVTGCSFLALVKRVVLSSFAGYYRLQCFKPDYCLSVINVIPVLQARAPDSVVIIVGTFYDQLTTQQKRSGFVERMHKLIYQLYVGKDLDGGIGIPRERGLPKVVRVIDVSCTSGHHINTLRDMIYTTALEIKVPGKFTQK